MFMKLFILLCLVSNKAFLCEPIDCSSLDSNDANIQLRKKLLCHYESTTRPGDRKDPLEVQFDIILKSFSYDDDSYKLTLKTYIQMTWNDNRLSWKPENHGGILETYAHVHDLWIPDVTIHHSVSLEGIDSCVETDCFIRFDGEVRCMHPCEHSTLCFLPDYSTWPVDNHVCVMIYSSMSKNEENLKYSKHSIIVDEEIIKRSSDWLLLEASIYEDVDRDSKSIIDRRSFLNDSRLALSAYIWIKRNNGDKIFQILIPAIVLMIVNACVVIIHPKHIERLMLLMINLLSHRILLEQLRWMLPQYGYRPPAVLMFFIYSKFVTLFLIFQTIFMKIFLESQDNPNILIKDLVLKINSKLYRKPTQESSELEEESQKEEKNEALDKLKENHLIRESFRSISDTFLFIAYCNKDTKNLDLKLKSTLLCDYEKELRPPSNTTSVALKYILRNFDYDDMSYVLNLQSRIIHKWNDTRLKWDPKDHDGINKLLVSPEYLWTPKLFLNDSHYHYGLGSCYPIDCVVRNEGQVSCIYPCHQTADCYGDFANWPYDTHTCFVAFKTFLSYEDVTFDSENLGAVIFTDLNKKWDIIEAKADMNDTNRKNIKFKFVIRRFSQTYFQHVLTPAYILVALTLFIFFMQPGSYLRTIICGVDIHLHLSLMDRVWWQIPTQGVNVPRILKYMAFMLILTTFAFIETIIIKVILDIFPSPPQWINNFSNFLESNILTKYFVMTFFDETIKTTVKDLEEEIGDVTPDEIKSNNWATFFHFIDRICFIACCLGYWFYSL
ncbi:CLUMA_CG018099, isoform A [Clunio marinus]|uniref:CLUMA_CG018099, isoform A n=1 Tax=Clunio marinus TaxID=568069 RepID=A0A1J1J3N8_9DIPT|nr:CLUMA_CG018099, isoform A [Clunio marinus]